MIRFFAKYHKWIGLVFTIFILMFAISGVFLNHRTSISEWDIRRNILPKSYEYNNWNNGAIAGTIKLAKNKVIIYGNNGMWLTDTLCHDLVPFNDGLRQGADNRNIRSLVKTDSADLFAISIFSVYRRSGVDTQWHDITELIKSCCYFTDIHVKGDTLVVLSRSHIHIALYPYQSFETIELQRPDIYSGSVSLFRTVWTLHSGEMFGLAGQVVVDIVGVITIILCLTGLILFFFRIPVKYRRNRGKDSKQLKRAWLFSLNWHNRLGSLFFILLLVIIVTGMFLRPPLLIPIARRQVPPLPGSELDSKNPWHDKLRKIRYDNKLHKWVVATTEGFYLLETLRSEPQKIVTTPPVSVMGVNVWTKAANDEWIIGSFSGIYRWNILQNIVTDYFSGRVVENNSTQNRPTFNNAISGYSADFSCGNVVFDYKKGALVGKQSEFYPMPKNFKDADISFWNVCLELHVGRLYYSFLRGFTGWFVFLSGLLLLFITVSGYVVYRKRYRQKKVQYKRRSDDNKTIPLHSGD